MDHSWLQRCLRKASTPPEILAIVESLLISMPVLILDGVEFAPLELASGLTQGCPASCMLYIIGVDPLLSSLQQTPHISSVSGFVDDWSMGCHGLSAISEVSNVIHDFEQASGQQINRGKSALIPARQLSDDERASCLAIWNSDIRISFRERVLGVLSASMCPFTINTTMQLTNLMSHFLSLVVLKCHCPLQCVCSW